MRPIDRIVLYIDELIENKMIFSAMEFEKACGFYYGMISNHKRGTGMMDGKALLAIHKAFPDLNMDWVVTGRGSMDYSGISSHYRKAYEIAMNQISVLNTIITENKTAQKATKCAIKKGRK